MYAQLTTLPGRLTRLVCLLSAAYMFFKIFTLAIKGLFQGDAGVLAVPLLWICVVLIGPNVVAQVYLMNMCLGSGATNFVVPAYTAASACTTANASPAA